LFDPRRQVRRHTMDMLSGDADAAVLGDRFENF
jgi:hypothetical protein